MGGASPIPGEKSCPWHDLCKGVLITWITGRFIREPPMTWPLERRRFPRLRVHLAVEYRLRLPDTHETLQGHGILRDLSLGGGYVQIKPPLALQTGQILSLTIAAPLPGLDQGNISRLHARGEVVRLEPPGLHSPLAGVALRFLETPRFLRA